MRCGSREESIVTKDFADFLESLNREGVAYVVIGGMAVLAHIPYRTTRDLDVLIEPTLPNGERARRAVVAWGDFEPEYTPADFIAGDILSFGGLLRVEVHSRVPGVEWEDVWNSRVESELLGVPTSFAGVDELIRMKRATGNAEKDLPDVQRLEALRNRGAT
jgi:hypothetical protein